MSNYPLSNYNWDFSGNKLPIANSTFAYGQLVQIAGSGVQGGLWSSLSVSSLFSNNINLISYTQNSSYLTFNVSGIYQITTSLQFIPSSGFSSGTQTFVFSYSTAANTASSFSYINNNINGKISFLDGSNNVTLGTSALLINGSASGGGSNSLASTNYGGQVALTTTNNSNIPFFILPNYSSSTINNNVNTITSIYYIPGGTTLYFNIGNGSTSTSNYINANGNFTVRLLKYILVPSVTSSNLTGTLNYSNGYYYYTFVPTTTTTSGTATITFTGNVAMNYLLVGGGGGGGGSYYFTSAKYYDGGGGGGGQSLSSSISGNTFNITVGNAGAGGLATAAGSPGGNTTLTSNGITQTCNGGGGGSSYSTSTGGTGGGSLGGTGFWILNTAIQFATNGLTGNTFSLSGIGLTYNVGGSGGGGGSVIGGTSVYGGSGGSSAVGGAAGGNGLSYTGGVGTGYGTGGGGASASGATSVSGGQGGSGLVVLYWAA